MQMREEAFAVVYRAGSVKSVSIELGDAGAVIAFELGDGTGGVIHTKRGAPKRYRLDTAARFLRGLGLVRVSLDMRLWTPEQPSLGV